MKLNRKHIIDTNLVQSMEGSPTKTSLDRPMLLLNALSRHIKNYKTQCPKQKHGSVWIATQQTTCRQAAILTAWRSKLMAWICAQPRNLAWALNKTNSQCLTMQMCRQFSYLMNKEKETYNTGHHGHVCTACTGIMIHDIIVELLQMLGR